VRAPMTSILIIFEMTGGYGLVLPMMIANMSAFALASHWRHTPIYEALLEQDGIFLGHNNGPQGPAGPVKLPPQEHGLAADAGA
jgi:CIC family chloride channel protein